tara:strand:- start:986 stop:2134 length:1149 start_codon:yes stop_codon:yes gene_type:complete
MWKTVKLGEASTFISRGIAPKYLESGGIRVLNQKCIRNNEINYDLARRHNIELKKFSEDRYVKLGDVLINSTGQGTLGRVAQVRKEPNEPTTVDSHITIVRPKKKLFYLEYFGYAAIAIETIIQQAGQGASGQTELAKSKVKNVLEISYPKSVSEQQRIVAKLDAAFAEIDKVEQVSNTSQITYPQLSRQIISQCLSNRNYNWNEKYLNQISINLDSKRKPIKKSKRIKGKVPYYGASGIVDYVDGYIFDDDLLLISEDGANLLSRSYPIAFSIKGRTWVNNHAHVLKFNSNNLQAWVEIYLNFKNISDYISGMAQPKLNQAKLNQIPIPIPEENELKEILQIIHTVKELIKKVQANRIVKLELLKKLKSSILSKELGINTL